MPTQRAQRLLTTVLLLASALHPAAVAAADVNIYSYREPQLIAPLLEAFTVATGIKPNIVFARDGLNERLAAEGRNSPADLLLTVDVARLVDAKQQGLLQLIDLPVVARAVPQHLRDPEEQWLSLSMRARVIYASRDRVTDEQLTYADLAAPRWKGRICMRSGQHPYNTALIAAQIAHEGDSSAEAWLRGVKANLAHRPSGGDREQVRDVHAGRCDIALGNTYYMGLMMTNDKAPEQKEWARSVKIIFPSAAGKGTHVNVSGIGLARHAPHKAEALKLIEFLVSETAQAIYAGINHEYPVNPATEPSELIKGLGKLVPDKLPLEALSVHRKRASELVDKVNFDAGPNS